MPDSDIDSCFSPRRQAFHFRCFAMADDYGFASCASVTPYYFSLMLVDRLCFALCLSFSIFIDCFITISLAQLRQDCHAFDIFAAISFFHFR